MEENRKNILWLQSISAIITIVDFTYRSLKNNAITMSKVTVAGLVVCILCVVWQLIRKNKKILYNIRKNLAYFLCNDYTYTIEEKECIYVFKSRTEMEHIKKHHIVSNVRDLEVFSDKFKWSKEQAVSDIKIACENPNHEVTVSRVENWNLYTVMFPEIGKGEEEHINVKISNLKDEKKESLLFLSSSIVRKTKKLKLVVKFEKPEMKPINIKYKIYDNYASLSPLLQKDIQYDEERMKIEIIEKKPIYGYRYMVTWEFEEG